VPRRSTRRGGRGTVDAYLPPAPGLDAHAESPRAERRASWPASDGAPGPLGVHWVARERAFDFAVEAPEATAVTLELYGVGDVEHPLRAVTLDPLRHRSGGVWHCRLPADDVSGAAYYAYRAAGERPWFDAEKVLLDPYAPAVLFPPRFNRTAARVAAGNAGRAPLGVLPAPRPPFDWGDDHAIRHDRDAVLYEMHVRGFTRRESSGVDASVRGTYAGVVEKIPYLRELGVTVVVLLPVFQFDPQEGRYWGAAPLHCFSPHRQYCVGSGMWDAIDEFRTMVRALHAVDIEVVIDVALDHTAEGGEDGPTYGMRGLATGSWYLLDPHDPARLRVGDEGTNLLATSRPTVRRHALDVLRFWAREMHVDGFRFDDRSIFARHGDGTLDPALPPLVEAIAADPELAHMRLVARGSHTDAHDLARAFPVRAWQRENARFREEVRRFVRGEGGMVGRLMTRLYGSDDLFPDRGPWVHRPWQGVNLVTGHDGFTLRDLVSYDRKHNEANGHGNRDGARDEWSWNCGHEGDRGATPEVEAVRRRQARNLVTLLLLAAGTPMLTSGDELLHSQRGNNHAYNQDDETTWLDWGRRTAYADHFRFVKELVAFRKAHPTLSRPRFWRDDVRWFGPIGEPDLGPESRALAWFLDGSTEGDVDLYVMINAWWHPQRFEIQAPPADEREWRRVLDTARPSPDEIASLGNEPAWPASTYDVAPRSVVVLMRP
jgi:glycogen operon protein